MVKESLDPNNLSDYSAQKWLHLERYYFARACLGDRKKIADAACGLGYGSRILSKVGHYVVGMDSSIEAIDYAKIHYGGDGVKFLVTKIDQENFSKFDVLVCFETLEHLDDPISFLRNLKVQEIILSAPIVPTKHRNPFHKHDFEERQIREVIEEKYKIRKFFYQEEYPWSNRFYIVLHAISSSLGHNKEMSQQDESLSIITSKRIFYSNLSFAVNSFIDGNSRNARKHLFKAISEKPLKPEPYFLYFLTLPPLSFTSWPRLILSHLKGSFRKN